MPSTTHSIAPVATSDSSLWTQEAITSLYDLPFNDLLYKAHEVHRKHHPVNSIQLSTLLSIKTGGCPEDCAYCPQSSRHDTHTQAQELMPLPKVMEAAQAAKEKGARRFCMGAAWRSPTERQIDEVADRVAAVKKLGLQTCVTLGMLKAGQAERLRDAGLDFYNHNLDTSPDYYGQIISTRLYQDRLDTLERVRTAGLSVCCGGIIGMGETRQQRSAFIAQLANMDPYPESVPINSLVKVPGTPLGDTEIKGDTLEPLEFVRTIAVARITMPFATVRLSAGREDMSEAVQALCFFAGANSIFYGDELLTTANPQTEKDQAMFRRLGLKSA